MFIAKNIQFFLKKLYYFFDFTDHAGAYELGISSSPSVERRYMPVELTFFPKLASYCISYTYSSVLQ